MSIDYSMIGMRIRQQRLSAGMTQDTAAETAGITTVYLSKIENGKAAPTLDTLAQICTVIRADLAYIICGGALTGEQTADEPVLELYHACAPEVRPAALKILRELSKIKTGND